MVTSLVKILSVLEENFQQLLFWILRTHSASKVLVIFLITKMRSIASFIMPVIKILQPFHHS